MSLFSSIGKILRRSVGAAVSTAIPIIGPSIGAQIAASAVPRSRGFAPPAVLPGVGAIMPAGGFLGTVPLRSIPLPPALRGPEGAACPAGFHLDKRTRTRCVRNRRMNFANGRAAKRSLRRIKGTLKLLKGIEKEIARAAPRPRTRQTPTRHITGPQHT